MNKSISISLCLLVAILGCSGEDSPTSADAQVIDASATDMHRAEIDQSTESDVQVPIDSYLTGEPCEPIVPIAATRRPGEQDDGTRLTVNGRMIGQLGTAQPLEGFPSNILPHPTAPVVYVTSTSHDDRLLLVLDKDTLTPIQSLSPSDVYAGLVLDPMQQHLYVSGGESSEILRYSIAEDGQLTLDSTIMAQGHVNYLAYDEANGSMWFSRWDEPLVHRINLETNEIDRTIEIPDRGWQLLISDGRLLVSMLAHPGLFKINLDDMNDTTQLELIGSVGGLCAMDSKIYASLADSDAIVRLSIHDPADTELLFLGQELINDDGVPYANTNTNSIACDDASRKVYASRGADNLISVIDGNEFEEIGRIPTGEYPTQLAYDSMTNRLWMSEGKGGTAPNDGRTGKSVISGFARLINLNEVDLEDATALAEQNFQRPKSVFPFDCEGFFPIPTRANQRSPIEHVILVVKENKTFDCIFGDLDPERADVDPDLVRFGANVTPNLHALADAFALSDNFYTEVEDSDIGHVILTATHLTEYVQRLWIEKDHSRHIGEGYQVTEPARPKTGNFFTQLMNHDISLKIMGEVVGVNARAAGDRGLVGQHIDLQFPGGGFVNYMVKDELKARHLANVIESNQLKQFTYILLPNDHTLGTRSGAPTPESMVADNDYAVGIIVDALSKSPYWMKSAVIILQDDPQGCRDHVDVHRSPLLVASPWAARNYVSHTRASFMSVFATIEHIFGIPPMGRGDASAAPLWDMFTATANPGEYNAIPRLIPETFNQDNAFGEHLSQRMDFRGPDRNPSLGPLLELHMAIRGNKISRQEADRRLRQVTMTWDRWMVSLEEAVEEVFSFDAGVAAYNQYLDEIDSDAPRYPKNGFNLGPNPH